MKFPLRSLAILNSRSDDKFCFLWSILAVRHICQNSHPNRVSYYRQFFDKLDIQEFRFTVGFKCSDVHILGKINKLSINLLELSFYQIKTNGKTNYYLKILVKIIQIELLTC